jgi:predicted ArsR family transcriptional regulator
VDRSTLPRRLAALATLVDPVRRSLYELVVRSPTPVGRDEAAQALGLSRRTAALHLDRLAEEGLLDVEYRRLSGRTGPGAGRPSKLYSRPAAEIAVHLPQRRYDLAAQLLATAVEASADSGEPVQEVLSRLAADTGRSVGVEAHTFDEALEEFGFEPRTDDKGGMTLANCPFHTLARDHTALVCGLNLELMRGIADGVPGRTREVVLDPGEGRCCVRVMPAAG